MNKNDTPINHSDIFSSVESFLDFFRPKDVEGETKKLCRSYVLPRWQPFHVRGQILVGGLDVLENGKIKMNLAMAVNPDMPFDVSLQNNWMLIEAHEASFEEMCGYFVNGTMIGKEGGGTLVITNGPKKFTWTYEEPEIPLCEECESKEAAQ